MTVPSIIKEAIFSLSANHLMKQKRVELKVWVAALRSGEYKQGQNWLRDGDEYCCLGVACDLYDNTRWENSCNLDHRVFSYMEEFTATPPTAILEHFGISYNDMSQLAEMNDSGKTFDEIADCIEAKFL